MKAERLRFLQEAFVLRSVQFREGEEVKMRYLCKACYHKFFMSPLADDSSVVEAWKWIARGRKEIGSFGTDATGKTPAFLNTMINHIRKTPNSQHQDLREYLSFRGLDSFGEQLPNDQIAKENDLGDIDDHNTAERSKETLRAGIKRRKIASSEAVDESCWKRQVVLGAHLNIDVDYLAEHAEELFELGTLLLRTSRLNRSQARTHRQLAVQSLYDSALRDLVNRRAGLASSAMLHSNSAVSENPWAFTLDVLRCPQPDVTLVQISFLHHSQRFWEILPHHSHGMDRSDANTNAAPNHSQNQNENQNQSQNENRRRPGMECESVGEKSHAQPLLNLVGKWKGISGAFCVGVRGYCMPVAATTPLHTMQAHPPKKGESADSAPPSRDDDPLLAFPCLFASLQRLVQSLMDLSPMLEVREWIHSLTPTPSMSMPLPNRNSPHHDNNNNNNSSSSSSSSRSSHPIHWSHVYVALSRICAQAPPESSLSEHQWQTLQQAHELLKIVAGIMELFVQYKRCMTLAEGARLILEGVSRVEGYGALHPVWTASLTRALRQWEQTKWGISEAETLTVRMALLLDLSGWEAAPVAQYLHSWTANEWDAVGAVTQRVMGSYDVARQSLWSSPIKYEVGASIQAAAVEWKGFCGLKDQPQGLMRFGISGGDNLAMWSSLAAHYPLLAATAKLSQVLTATSLEGEDALCYAWRATNAFTNANAMERLCPKLWLAQEDNGMLHNANSSEEDYEGGQRVARNGEPLVDPSAAMAVEPTLYMRPTETLKLSL